MEDVKKPRVVVCAAMRGDLMVNGGGIGPVLLAGPRHLDGVMFMQTLLRDDIELMKLGVHVYGRWSEAEQGFIDQFGVFMTREEAYEVAKAAGQIKYRCGGDEGRLFSENMY